MIKVGDQVITSKGRYGKIIRTDSSNYDVKHLVRIGVKDYWILDSQLTLASHTIRLKVTYGMDYCGHVITDSMEVALKRDTIIFNENGNYLVQLCKNAIESQLNTEVTIKQIKIS